MILSEYRKGNPKIVNFRSNFFFYKVSGRMMAIHNEWDPACKVWIGNLGNEGTKLEIEDAFSEIGVVKNIWLAKNPPGFAFVEMEVGF
jgi:RNA recognition motif-containing protein